MSANRFVSRARRSTFANPATVEEVISAIIETEIRSSARVNPPNRRVKARLVTGNW